LDVQQTGRIFPLSRPPAATAKSRRIPAA
jgi:hypothetical protein